MLLRRIRCGTQFIRPYAARTAAHATPAMHLATLKLFCDLVETESFTLAAERNFVSQSAVSQRIRTLEREYGQVFLARGKGRGPAVPTEAGRLLYEGAKPLLAGAD